MNYNKNIKYAHNKDIGEIIIPDGQKYVQSYTKYFQDIFTEFRLAMKKSDRRNFKG